MKNGESSLKKVDYKIKSDKKCPHCGENLKQNAVNNGYTMCYPCKKISDGKKVSYKYYFDSSGRHVQIDNDGNPIIAKDFVKIQKENRIKNGWKKAA